MSLWGWSPALACRAGGAGEGVCLGTCPEKHPLFPHQILGGLCPPEQKCEPRSRVGLWPGGACPQGCRDMSQLCPSPPRRCSLGFPPQFYAPPLDFCLVCLASTAEACGRLGFTVIIYYRRCAEALSYRRGRLPRLRSDQAAMSPYGKGKALGRGKQPGLGTGVPPAPLAAQ